MVWWLSFGDIHLFRCIRHIVYRHLYTGKTQRNPILRCEGEFSSKDGPRSGDGTCSSACRNSNSWQKRWLLLLWTRCWSWPLLLPTVVHRIGSIILDRYSCLSLTSTAADWKTINYVCTILYTRIVRPKSNYNNRWIDRTRTRQFKIVILFPQPFILGNQGTSRRRIIPVLLYNIILYDQ